MGWSGLTFGLAKRLACLSLALITSCLIGVAAHSTRDSPPIHVSLTPPWPSAPLLLEILEATATQKSEAFFRLLTAMTGTEMLPNTTSAEGAQRLLGMSAHTTYKKAELETFWEELLGDEEAAYTSWSMAIALHAETPKIEALWQMYATAGLDDHWSRHTSAKSYKECGSWVDWDGKVLCTAQEVREVLKTYADKRRTKPASPHPALLPFDHILPVPPSSTPAKFVASQHNVATALLYADPFAANFRDLHEVLYERALEEEEQKEVGRSSRFQYALRWRPPPYALASSNQTLDFPVPKARAFGSLAGYGASLDLKKVDYLVIDDRKLKDAVSPSSVRGYLSEAEETLQREQLQNRLWLENELGSKERPSSEGLGSLEKEEIASLGFRAVQAIVSSSEPLRALKQLTQDFPFHAVSLARDTKALSKALVDEINANHENKMRDGTSDAFLNGRSINSEQLDPFHLITLFDNERKLYNSLTQAPLNLTYPQVYKLLTDGQIGETMSTSSADVTFDASDRIERGIPLGGGRSEAELPTAPATRAITWWNDLEKDESAKRFPTGLGTLLQPLWPNSFPVIGRNIHHVVLVMDFSRKETCRFISESISAATQRIGIRWGLVPGGLEGQDDTSLQLARLFWYVLDAVGPQGTTKYLHRLATATTAGERVTVSLASIEFKAALQGVETSDVIDAKLAELTDTNKAKEDDRVRAAQAYARRLGASTTDWPRGHAFVNGIHVRFAAQIFQHINKIISGQTQSLARAIYQGDITDEDDLSYHFSDAPGVLTSRTPLLFPPVVHPNATQPASKIHLPPPVDLLSSARIVNETHLVQHFLLPNVSEGARINATLWVAGDLDSEKGRQLLLVVLDAMLKDASFRLGFVHVPPARVEPSSAPSEPPLSSLLSQLYLTESLDRVPAIELKQTIVSYRPAQNNLDTAGQIVEATVKGGEAAQYVEAEALRQFSRERGWSAPAAAQSDAFWTRAGRFAQELGVGGDEYGLILNGKIVAGFDPTSLDESDIQGLVEYETTRSISPIVKSLDTIGYDLQKLDGPAYSDVITYTSSVLIATFAAELAKEGAFTPPVSPRIDLTDAIPFKKAGIEIGDAKNAMFRFLFVLNPLAESTQRWAALLPIIIKYPNVYVQIIFNPDAKLEDLPLKRFYRYSAPDELLFDDQGAVLPTSLTFLGLPEEAVLTLGIDAPPAWLTMQKEAIYDLDNIRLADVPAQGRSAGVKAVYELKQILIEGHARQGNVIPRGLQLVLDTPDNSAQLDTIVMANLAYFQFRAQPGVYKLGIREGRSSEVYQLLSAGGQGWDSPSVEEAGDVLVLRSFDGLTLYPRFEKRKGMEREELTEDLDAPKDGNADATGDGLEGAMKAASDTFGFLKNKAGAAIKAATSAGTTAIAKKPQADINIFTVASGHLYERMTYIMILSVLKHTKHTVKFWFIENFLSPSFKEFIPHLANARGFEYELVSYAWPHWLRSQREKQRTIWGTKILFLDVLFPLDLQKVIFVDADQIVRTDLKELVDEDLHGAPYGYPPMGDDSYDMDGFRFWKQGYWKDFLRGRPYHISALYVVDLARFRRIAAGDQLRGQYQGLSADPNSLANLDQDLPNNLQFQLPIHTLDKTWLWCETWCSDSWLSEAKTIDLCSNPKTKEPKLDRARRQIPEWTVYDDEVAEIARQVREKGKLGSGNIVVDTVAKQGEDAVVGERKDELVEEVADEPGVKSDVPEDRHSHDEL